jgi:cytochrome c oxidase subunit 2
MTPEARVRDALHALASSGRPDEVGAYDRFLRRHARRLRLEAAAGGLMVLALLALVAFAPRLPPGPDRAAGGLRSPKGRLTVEVTAYQWGWRFAYQDAGVRVASRSGVAPELVVPAGEPVRFRLTSADVVHSFSLPNPPFERDAIPGETVAFELRFDRVGTYPGRCGVYCGLPHSEMRFTVRVLPRDAFSRWLWAASAGAGP